MSKVSMDDVNSLYQAIAGLPAISPVFDNLVWTEMAGGPYGGVYNSTEEIIENVFSKINADWEDFALAPQEFVITDETIIMIGNYTGKSRKTGKALNARAVHIFKKSGDKLLFEQCTDTALFRE